MLSGGTPLQAKVARPPRKVHSDQIKLVDRVFSLENMLAIKVRLSQRLGRANLPQAQACADQYGVTSTYSNSLIFSHC